MIATIIGRAHSGTRAIAKTLSESGFYLGNLSDPYYDTEPYEPMHTASRIISKGVRLTSSSDWDFSGVLDAEIPDRYSTIVEAYLRPIMRNPSELKGWKRPETTLNLPWIARLYPDVKYIHIVRDPRDVIQKFALVQNLGDCNVPHPQTHGDERLARALAWKYAYDIVKATPKPANWLQIRFEDFVLKQEETVRSMEAFLGVPLVRIPVQTAPVGRWKTDTGRHDFDFLLPAMRECGYE